ncbi:hypothetical protein BDR22DRAFT_851101 [Usnea florida]
MDSDQEEETRPQSPLTIQHYQAQIRALNTTIQSQNATIARLRESRGIHRSNAQTLTITNAELEAQIKALTKSSQSSWKSRRKRPISLHPLGRLMSLLPLRITTLLSLRTATSLPPSLLPLSSLETTRNTLTRSTSMVKKRSGMSGDSTWMPNFVKVLCHFPLKETK